MQTPLAFFFASHRRKLHLAPLSSGLTAVGTIRAPIGSNQHLRDVPSITECLHAVSSSGSIEHELVYSPTEGGRWPFLTWAHHPRRLFSNPFQTSSLSAELLQIALCNQPFDISLTDIELRVLGKIDCATYLISQLSSEIYI
jgi:hypothetical protein